MYSAWFLTVLTFNQTGAPVTYIVIGLLLCTKYSFKFKPRVNINIV